MYECKVCAEDPTSHSLRNLGEKNGTTYFYTCPAKASRYDDADGILNHYDGVLSENQGNWVWVFDSKGFGLKHLAEVRVGIRLAKLITDKFSVGLKRIVILNATWHIKTVVEIVSPFLSAKTRSLITFDNKTKKS
jgi:hypothetical protein